MRSYFRSSTREGELLVPPNLTEWVDETSLHRWIAEEIEALDWSDPKVESILRAHPTYQPKMLLTLLTYAYATAVYESDEVVQLCDSSEPFRLISGGRPPETAGAVKRFRRENRGLLKWCLVQVFKRAIREKAGEVLLPAGLKRQLVENAVMRLDVARHMDRGAEGV